MRWYVNTQSEEAALLRSKHPEDAKPPGTLNRQSHSCDSRSKARTTARAAQQKAEQRDVRDKVAHVNCQQLRPRTAARREGVGLTKGN